ncbi:expressed unknown protein [Seminavis robusta]|nr:expressed unknown protein [Seminavis robusta]|eukprot:Sro3323_g346790.1 n/a (434) ;mRNA; r:5729-7438
MSDDEENLGHPDSCIRLASAVHRFKVPIIDPDQRLSFVKSFKTTGTHPKTKTLMLKADEARKKVASALEAQKVSHERVLADSKRYLPFIHQILLSCKVQPEVARLDERLQFSWVSGLETERNFYQSEALMFDLVMSMVCEGLGNAGLATEASIGGDFAAASRYYKAAAGVFHFLAHTQLPTWSAKGSNVSEESLPVECSVHVAEAMEKLFMANAQQMAVATVLIKPGVPNYGLLGKLCLGISDELDKFTTKLRKEAFKLMTRVDKDIFALINFQVALQKSLSLYFQARALWEKADYGNAISLLSQATVELKTEKSGQGQGVPDVTQNKALKPLKDELTDLRNHYNKLLHSWEKDNSTVYFESVPQQVPVDKRLQDGLVMGKMEPYSLAEVEPVLLILPDDTGGGGGSSRPAMERSDSDIARDLQKRLNDGLDI